LSLRQKILASNQFRAYVGGHNFASTLRRSTSVWSV